jgi:DNA-binding GntR family transcriptional regulator
VDLAGDIGVSRTPVRDALRQLENEGLVKISPRLGASVRSLNSTEFRELCEMRLALESLAAELAAKHRGPDHLLEIQDTVEAMDRALLGLQEDPGAEALRRELIRQDLRFHFAVLKAARNNLVRAEILRLHLLNRVVWMTVNKEQQVEPVSADEQKRLNFIQQFHRRIFEAIKAQDSEAARKAMHEHITDILDKRLRAVVRMENNRELTEMASEDAPDAYDSPVHPSESDVRSARLDSF